MLLSLWQLVAFAQPPLPVDGALYLGKTERGRTILVSLHLFAPNEAELQLLEAPAEPGEGEASLELALTASYLEHDQQLEVTAESWAFIADVHEHGVLNARGRAELHLDGLAPIQLHAIGTVILGGPRLADGSFIVQRWAPFFYAEPWSQVVFDVSADELIKEGLEQRRELPDSPVGIFMESQTVQLTAFSGDLLSYYTLIDSFTGGAHPNSWRQATTLVRNSTGSWVVTGSACNVAQRLGWECAESTLRATIIEELLRQGAAWVEQGEVTRDTDWLLESFVLTPTGIRFLFDAYLVGPYVQGAFEVDVPYGALGD